jgi:hypothetical protein
MMLERYPEKMVDGTPPPKNLYSEISGGCKGRASFLKGAFNSFCQNLFSISVRFSSVVQSNWNSANLLCTVYTLVIVIANLFCSITIFFCRFYGCFGLFLLNEWANDLARSL